ncbi:hypothetical protein RFI_03233 [Reticulomyxa filosa]|uniref:Uncharacterized protein n=1 Tax=Reticulomyxa filosa TaxID=46433 RepID=X6P8C1_RETFI|nr:hypothetical protein RFI_03233 [Reticulomyxa filosa]|eukprot:ETO33862.1 hypothetical protein RFI_03233 [Reticulomyxa filosa]
MQNTSNLPTYNFSGDFSNLALDQLSGQGSARRIRTETDYATEAQYSQKSSNNHQSIHQSANSERIPRVNLPNESALDMSRPLSDRFGKKMVPKFWMKCCKKKKKKYECNMGIEYIGIEAMLQRFEGAENEIGNIDGTDIPRLITSRKQSMNGSTPTTNSSNNRVIKDRHESSTFPVRTISGTYLSAVMQPTEVSNEEWEESVRIWEAEGEWVEARETLSGRIMWYNTKSFRLVFDTAPEGVKPVTGQMASKSALVNYLHVQHITEDILMLFFFKKIYLTFLFLFKKKKASSFGHEEHLANRPITPYDGEDVVDALLNFGMHQWDFDNDMVDVYRSKASQRNHQELLPAPEQYAFPEYFSESPLPELPGNQFLAKIRLPEEFAAHRR